MISRARTLFCAVLCFVRNPSRLHTHTIPRYLYGPYPYHSRIEVLGHSTIPIRINEHSCIGYFYI